MHIVRNIKCLNLKTYKRLGEKRQFWRLDWTGGILANTKWVKWERVFNERGNYLEFIYLYFHKVLCLMGKHIPDCYGHCMACRRADCTHSILCKDE